MAEARHPLKLSGRNQLLILAVSLVKAVNTAGLLLKIQVVSIKRVIL